MPHANLMTILYYTERRQHAVAGGHLPLFAEVQERVGRQHRREAWEGMHRPDQRRGCAPSPRPGTLGLGRPVPRSGGGNRRTGRGAGGKRGCRQKVPACRDPGMPRGLAPRRGFGAVGGGRCRPPAIAAVTAALTPERSGAAVPRHPHPTPTSHLWTPCPAPGISAGLLPRSPPPAKQPRDPHSSGFVPRCGAGGGASTARSVPVAKFEAAPPSPKRVSAGQMKIPLSARHWSQSRPAAGRRSLVRLSHRNAALPACCVKGQEGYFFLYRCICF